MSQTEANIYCHTCGGAYTAILDEPLPLSPGDPAEVPRHEHCSGREGVLQWQQPLDEGCQMMEEEFPDVISTGDIALNPRSY